MNKRSSTSMDTHEEDEDGHESEDEDQNEDTPSLAEYIDSLRIKRLENHGYNVTTDEIPREYTPKNSVILAAPTIIIDQTQVQAQAQYPAQNQHHPQQKQKQRSRPRYEGIQPYLFQVPIGNDPKSMEIIRKLSGRAAAELRKAPPPPSLCVSMFMPKKDNDDTDNDNGTDHLVITPQCLLSVVDKIWNIDDDGDNNNDYDNRNGNGDVSSIKHHDNNDNDDHTKKQHQHTNNHAVHDINVDIEYFDDGPYLHPNGLSARTFRITYHQENGERIGKERAKELHGQFCDCVSMYIQGLRVRR